jgi:hypothetical protein
MDTFRKSFFILYSRGPKGRLLVTQEKVGINDRKILPYSPTVKEKIAFVTGLPFQAHIEGLGLEWCIPKEDSKISITGRKGVLCK